MTARPARCVAVSWATHRRCHRRAAPIRGYSALCGVHARDGWLMLQLLDGDRLYYLRREALQVWEYGSGRPAPAGVAA